MEISSDIIDWLQKQVDQGEMAAALLKIIDVAEPPSSLPPENLSPHFTLQEMIYSATAISRGIDNTPNADQITQLTLLCQDTLEGIRTLCGDNPVVVSSGFRSPQLNAAIGGASNSAHMYGCAADFTIAGYGTPKQICQLLQKNVMSLNIDQLIWEYPSGTQWVHCGIAIPPNKPRYQVLTISPNGTYNGLVG